MSGGPVQIEAHESLRDPTLILAYAGWNDGGEAATYALRQLLDAVPAEKLATLETEEFLDFTVVRPHVRVDAGGVRGLKWPDHEFFSVRAPGQPCDLAIGLGVEPHLRWRAYVRAMLELVQGIGCERVVILGAYLDEVIYSQPVAVIGSATDPELQISLHDETPQYEGPTGMVGVLGHELEAAGIGVVSLWAALPHYVQRTPNPRAALALLQRFSELSGYRLDLSELSGEAAEFDQEVSEMIAADPQLAAYVRELKKRAFSS